MSANCANPVMLNQLGSTGLYEPANPGPNQWMLFLLWNAPAQGPPISVEDTWAEQGNPEQPGYFLFLNTIPSTADLAAFEAAVRKEVNPAVTTGFAWVAYAAGPPVTATILGLFATMPDPADAPVIDGDSSIDVPPGFKNIGVADQSAVFAVRDNGCIGGFSVSCPPLPGAEPPRGPGLTLPITVTGVGCLRFRGLVDGLGPGLTAPGDAVVKALVSVSIDPLHPLDTGRNYEIFTGRDYLFTSENGIYRLSPWK